MQISHPVPGRLLLEYGQPAVAPVLVLVFFLLLGSCLTLIGEAAFLQSDGTTCQAVQASNWSQSVLVLPPDRYRGASVGEVPDGHGRMGYGVFLAVEGGGPVFWTRWASRKDAQEVGREVDAFVKAHEAGTRSFGDDRRVGWGLAGLVALVGAVSALRMTQRVATTIDARTGQVVIMSSWPWGVNRYDVKLPDVERLRRTAYRGGTRIDLVCRHGAGTYCLGLVGGLDEARVLSELETALGL